MKDETKCAHIWALYSFGYDEWQLWISLWCRAGCGRFVQFKEEELKEAGLL